MLNQTRFDDIGKLIVRMMVGVLILLHGVHKILNPGSLDSIRNMLASIGLPSLLAYGVYFGEVVGALMVILGIYSRIGACSLPATCYLRLRWLTGRRYSRLQIWVAGHWSCKGFSFCQGLQSYFWAAAGSP